MKVFLTRVHKLWSILLHWRCWRGLRYGVAASMDHEAVLKLLASAHCQTVVDVGASRGQFALAVHAFLPQARIFGFEPLNGPASDFRKLFRSYQEIRLEQIAIGAHGSVADMHVSRSDDNSSLLPIGALQEKYFPGTTEHNIEKVRVECLCNVVRDTELISPALLKIDVQGYELEVLKGSIDLLHCFEYAYIECSFVELYQGQPLADEVIAFLREHGFRLGGVHNLAYDKQGVTLQGDFLFARC